MLKAITLYDPWASLMAIGAKSNETRPGNCLHRGDIAIHVARTGEDVSDEVLKATRAAFRKRGLDHWDVDKYAGCIIAVVELYEVKPSQSFFQLSAHADYEQRAKAGQIPVLDEEWLFGNYEFGRFIYRTRNLRRLKEPVKARGYQAVGWTVPPDIEAKVRATVIARNIQGCPKQ